MTEDTTDTVEAAAYYRTSILQSSDQSLRASLARLVVGGVEQGLVRVDPESSLAFAETVTSTPEPLPPGASWEEREAHSTHPWFREYRAVQDLKYALRCADMQEVALRALGAGLVDAGVYPQMLAMGLAVELSLVAAGRVPQPLLARVKRVLDAQADAYEGVEIWQSALENAFLTLVMSGARSPREEVDWLLTLLRASTTDLPLPFRNPKPEHLEAAEQMMVRRAQTRPGPRPNNWALAREFAAAFVVKMPETKRDARRRHGAMQNRI